jgi:hypothetical protein
MFGFRWVGWGRRWIFGFERGRRGVLSLRNQDRAEIWNLGVLVHVSPVKG